MSETSTWKVIEAIADSKGVEPDDLDVTLTDHIDLDAIEKLAKHNDSTWELKFELPTQRVTVKSNGKILVDDRVEQNWISA